MSALAALDNVVALPGQPRAALRAVDRTPAPPAEVQPWELNSELVLVCPELRARSLELLRDRDPVEALGTRPSPPILLPVPAVEGDEPQVVLKALLRFAARRVGESVRFGLSVIGALVMLALLAETLVH